MFSNMKNEEYMESEISSFVRVKVYAKNIDHWGPTLKSAFAV